MKIMFMKNDKSAPMKSCKLLFAILLAAPLIGFAEKQEEKIISCNGRYEMEIIGANKDLKFLAKHIKIFKEVPGEDYGTFVVGKDFVEQVTGEGYPNLKLKLCNSSAVIDTYSTKCMVGKNSRLLDEWLRLEQEDGAKRDVEMKSFYEKYEKDNIGVSSVAFMYLDKVNLTLTMDDISLEEYSFFRDKNGKIFEFGDERIKNKIIREGGYNNFSRDYNHWARRGIYKYRCEVKKPKI